MGEKISKNKAKAKKENNRKKPEEIDENDENEILPDDSGELLPTMSADRPPENRAFTNLTVLHNIDDGQMDVDSGEGVEENEEEVAILNDEAEHMWSEARQHSEPLAAQLCERLRAILEPSVNSKFK